jgi:hypothetical protein
VNPLGNSNYEVDNEGQNRFFNVKEQVSFTWHVLESKQ